MPPDHVGPHQLASKGLVSCGHMNACGCLAEDSLSAPYQATKVLSTAVHMSFSLPGKVHVSCQLPSGAIGGRSSRRALGIGHLTVGHPVDTLWIVEGHNAWGNRHTVSAAGDRAGQARRERCAKP